eukprot:GHRR01010563.1.p1 GENE.GHRR01010563.1~~GHRR01010563.1.p1  ORF type:complete len:308 (+),score=91.35 GHRR01010563.1:249-1172(+)
MSAIGTTRNLTSQFVRYRNDAKRARAPEPYTDDRATAKLLGAALGSDSADIEMGSSGISASYAPSWVARSEKIKGQMAVLKDRINKLKEYHSKALLVSFDSENAASSHVDVLTREVQAGFKRLDADIRGMAQPEAQDDDAQVRLQVQRQLAQALFKLSVEFRKEETRFLNKMEAQKGLAAGSSIGLIEDEGTGGAFTDPGFTETQLQKVSQAEALVEERDEEIRKIVETIAELAQIMRDLSTLVVEQGTMLDRIDHNVTQTAMKVEEGVKELVKAEKTQRAGRAMLCIIFLVVLITVMLIVAIVRHI